MMPKSFADSSINLLFQEKKLPDVSRKLNHHDIIVVGSVLLGGPVYPS